MTPNRRPADPELDFELLFALRKDGFLAHVEKNLGPWIDEAQRGFLASDLADRPYELLLADDGTPIGCVSISQHADHDYVEDIVIAAAHRNRGIGTAVMREVMAAAQARGVPVRLSVLDGNPVHALYQRLGFRVARVEPPRTKYEWP